MSAGGEDFSGDESAADAEAALARLLPPNGPEVHANRGKNRDVKNREQVLRKVFGGIHLDGYAAEAKIENASAASPLFAQNGVGVGTDHGDAFGFALNGEDARGRSGEVRGDGGGSRRGRGFDGGFRFFRRTFCFDGNWRRWNSSFLKSRSGRSWSRGSGGGFFAGGEWLGARCAAGLAMIGVFHVVETFVRDANQLFG